MTESAPKSADPPAAMPIAVSLLTGFLGSGKTTLLNYLLAHPDMDRTAVLINEFGEVGLDHLMVREIDGNAVLLKSGCICCTVQGELVEGLRELYMKRLAGRLPPFSRVVIETTGLADPLPIIACLMRDPLFKHAYSIDTLVTTVDAVYGERQLDDHDEALRQAAVADRILVTKSDLTNDAMIARLHDRLSRLNPGAQILLVRFGRVSPRDLFSAGIFEPSRKSQDVQRWLNQEAYAASSSAGVHRHGKDAPPHHLHERIDLNRHDDHIGSFCLTIDEPIAWNIFKEWYEELAEKNGDSLLRVKGIVNILGVPTPFLIHGVQSTQHEPTPLPSWPDEDRRSRIVFITRDLSREVVERGLRDRLAQGSSTGAPPMHVAPSTAVATPRRGAGRWLNPAELSRLIAALTGVQDRDAADALRLMLLTGASAEEARTACWAEFDLTARVWRKPAPAPKQGAVRPRSHPIPVGDVATMLLTVLSTAASGAGNLFPGLAAAVGMARLERTWAVAARRAGIDNLPLAELPPALATDLFTGLAPDLTRALLGLGTDSNRDVA